MPNLRLITELGVGWKIWHKRIYKWAFDHFPSKQDGEWFVYLHRDGSISLKLKSNLRKGPVTIEREISVEQQKKDILETKKFLEPYL